MFCLFVPVHISTDCWHIGRAATVNTVVALSGPKGVVPSNDQHIGRGLLLCFNR